MKKKVLIHTLFYENYNYGGILQAYALYHKLSEMGYSCEELNYNRIITGKVKKILCRGWRILEIAREPIYNIKMRKQRKIQEQQRQLYISKMKCDLLKEVFSCFMEKEFISTKVYTGATIKELSVYDYYIVGGDQVWNPQWTDINFFFGNVYGRKKIGYSCSAGKDHFTKHEKKKILKLIKNMDVVSVREHNFSELLSEEGINNQVIADPVYLMTRDEWSEFSNDCYQLPEKYIFAYLLGEDEERRKIIKNFAKQNNMKIVSIPHVFRRYNIADEDFADVEINDAGPKEFVSLIKNADFVVTDSFHGTAFSLIFEKQFLNFSRFRSNDKRSLNVRLINILKEYGIEDRHIELFELEKVETNKLKEIDYIQLINITQRKRKEAIDFLRESLL